MRDDIQTTHVYTTAQRNSNLGNASGRPVSPEMVCESCSASFNIFNRKVSYLSLPISTDLPFVRYLRVFLMKCFNQEVENVQFINKDLHSFL